MARARELNEIQKIKCVLLGAAESGKSKVAQQFCQKIFSDKYVATIGVDFYSRKMRHDDREYGLQIWDTSGQERFSCLLSSYLGSARIVIFCCDLTNEHSLSELMKIYDSIKSNISSADQPVIALVGTKLDLAGQRKITEMELMSFCEKRDWRFLGNCSAKNNDDRNVEAIFTKALEYVARAEKNKLELSAKESHQVDRNELLEQYRLNGGGWLATSKIFGFFGNNNAELAIEKMRERRDASPVGASAKTLRALGL